MSQPLHKKTSPGYTKKVNIVITEKLGNKITRDLYRNRLEKITEQNNIPTDNDTEQSWES